MSTEATYKCVCAWCGGLIRHGNEPVSHGVCARCAESLLVRNQELAGLGDLPMLDFRSRQTPDDALSAQEWLEAQRAQREREAQREAQRAIETAPQPGTVAYRACERCGYVCHESWTRCLQCGLRGGRVARELWPVARLVGVGLVVGVAVVVGWWLGEGGW